MTDKEKAVKKKYLMENVFNDGDPITNEFLSMVQIELELAQLNLKHLVTTRVAHDIVLNNGTSYLNDMTQQIVLDFQSMVLQQKVVDKKVGVEFWTPRTWWDMFKETHFPKWLLKRYPINKASHRKYAYFEEFARYPEFWEYVPDKSGRVIYTYRKGVL